MCACVWRPEVDGRCFPQLQFTLVFETDSSWPDSGGDLLDSMLHLLCAGLQMCTATLGFPVSTGDPHSDLHRYVERTLVIELSHQLPWKDNFC